MEESTINEMLETAKKEGFEIIVTTTLDSGIRCCPSACIPQANGRWIFGGISYHPNEVQFITKA